MRKVMDDALRSEIEVLAAEIQRYEDLRDGRIDRHRLQSLADLPTALIEGRIAARLTQKALGDRLGLKQQQVQRWESNCYAGVGVGRLQEVADALSIRIEGAALHYASGAGERREV